MKIRVFALFGFLFTSSFVNAQEQFYSTVDVTANILDVAYDVKLINDFYYGRTNVVAGVRGSAVESNSWPQAHFSDVLWVKLNKTVNCSGQDIENFVVLPMKIQPITPAYAANSPSTPWVAVQTQEDYYAGIKNLFFTAFTNNLQIKFTRIICGQPQLHPVKNQLVPVAYIQGQRYFSVMPPLVNNSPNNSAWINGVQVTPTNAQPTNAVVTNWNFTIPTAGNYDVYVHWVSNKNQVANISYAVNGQPLKSAALDQNINAGIWAKLIKNTQYSAGEQSIKISVDANANYIVDGVRAEKSAQ
ncbi:golvesin C-terminal-like domain-containing protein [Cellvibrio mixtus]|uniref:golvesin C-terminal-like domain-containing protein n=1 Tax=Cellvibrio mixtus TaxID=39650 RepID=UPI000587A26D|nr:hypothetical protein [Cellvibrio mixtus]